MPVVTLLYFDGCPNWRLVDERLHTLADDLDLTIAHRKVDTTADAEHTGFRGSPTVLVDGVDPFVAGAEPESLACRVYDTEHGLEGAPTLEQLRSVLAADPG